MPINSNHALCWVATVAAYTLMHITTALAQATLLNASYDVSRELYKDVNAAFVRHWRERTGETITINQSHGGSSRQALSVIAASRPTSSP